MTEIWTNLHKHSRASRFNKGESHAVIKVINPFCRRLRFAFAVLAALNSVATMANGLPAGAAAKGQSEDALTTAGKALVYAATGPELRVYELDLDSATLSQKSAVTLPATIEAGCVYPTGRYVLVAWSDGTNHSAGSRHGLSAYRVDAASETLLSTGEPVPLPSRPIYVSIDPSARHALVAYTSPSGVTVHRLASDGSVGPAIPQEALQLGIYGHQILVDPGNSLAILVARGNVPDADREEDPGALNVFGYEDGRLWNRATVAPNRGYGFHPRYVGFHPSRPWVYVSLSQQNAIGVYGTRKDGTLSAHRLFEKNSLADPDHVQPGQLSGALHVHPGGRYVYMANRATGASDVEGKPVFAGGENSIAVFEIDAQSGEPKLIQDIDTRGIGPAEFALDPGGKLLVVANMKKMWVGDEGSLTPIPPRLALFRVRDDGRLDFVRTYDVESGNRTLFWVGIGTPP
jgi:6-phosphogluconolactonase